MKKKYLNDVENEVLKVIKKSKKSLTKDDIIEKTKSRISRDYDEDIIFTDEDINIINEIIDDFISSYDLIKVGNGYKYINNTSFHKGIFNLLKKGNGVVYEDTSYIKDGEIIPQKEQYIIDRENFNGAHDGDKVLVDVRGVGKHSLNKIYSILDNGLDIVYGEVYKNEYNGFSIKPINKRYKDVVVYLDEEQVNNLKLVEGSRVRAKVTHTDTDDPNFYRVVLIDKLKHRDEPGEDVFWEALRYGMDNDFSEESLKQVDWTPSEVLVSDRIGRSDLTDLETFTIDGKDTKDMDDAISCFRLNNGNFMLKVHIADVAHYIPKNSALDIDAYRKSTSTYAGGKVIPMLPHELSNGICSLNPNVDRLAVTCSMEIDKEGNVCNYNIFNSVINSDIKMSYDKVNDILKGGKIDSKYKKYSNTLNIMNQLALILRKKRIKDGSIEFGVGDRELVFDEDGVMIGARERKIDYAEGLIEEFMVVANETVDKHLSRYGYPCLHRVHGSPNENRVSELIRLLNIIGFNFNMLDANDCVSNPKYMQKLADFVKNTGELSDILAGKLIRGMAKAKYSPNNIGHYGLGKTNYCHFTSPIRRYPDLVIHRILKETTLSEHRGKKTTVTDLLEIGQHTSKKERDASEVERAVYDKNCASFLQDHVGEQFIGSVTDLNNNGLNVRLDNFMEGLVRFKDKDTYFDEDTYTFIVGDEEYHFGDRLVLEVLKNNDVLPLHHTKEEKDDYDKYFRDHLDKIDNRNSYFKIIGKIHKESKVLKK